MLLQASLCVLVAITLMPSLEAQVQPPKFVCGYNHKSYYREDSGKFLTADLEHALSICTHVIYESAKIDADYKLVPNDDDLDTDSGKGNYKAVNGLKKRYPGVKIFLSVGGWDDKNDEDPSEKYLALLRDPNRRGTFISTARSLLEKYGFDGLDLAWQFPRFRVQPRSTLGGAWHKFKKVFGAAKGTKDELADEHKAGFSALIKQMKLAFRPEQLMLSATVIPQTNYTLYYDLREIIPYLDFLNIQAFDYLTPQDKNSPQSADYPASLYASYDRNPNFNVDTQLRWFLDNGAQSNKLVLGIPTYARTWKINVDTSATGVPPIEADGKGAEGHLTKKRGVLSYGEICSMLQNPNNHGTKGLLRRVPDPSKKLGTFAWRPEDSEREGIWAGFEEPETVKYKAEFAKKKSLGGIAMYDLSLDDFRGVCVGDRYPLLKAAKAGFI